MNADRPLVKHFKTQSKALLNAVRAGERSAILRVEAHLRDGISDFGLMKAQFVIARESGFSRWSALLRASDDELHDAIAKRKESGE